MVCVAIAQQHLGAIRAVSNQHARAAVHAAMRRHVARACSPALCRQPALNRRMPCTTHRTAALLQQQTSRRCLPEPARWRHTWTLSSLPHAHSPTQHSPRIWNGSAALLAAPARQDHFSHGARVRAALGHDGKEKGSRRRRDSQRRCTGGRAPGAGAQQKGTGCASLLAAARLAASAAACS